MSWWLYGITQKLFKQTISMNLNFSKTESIENFEDFHFTSGALSGYKSPHTANILPPKFFL